MSAPDDAKNAGLRCAFYHESDTPYLLGHHASTITSAGWTVVNAPRSLPGAITWKGDPRNGEHYAAGPRDEYEARWNALGACELRSISNTEVRAAVAGHIKAHRLVQKGETEQRAIDRMGGMHIVALSLQLPWLDEGMLELELVGLRERIEEQIGLARGRAQEQLDKAQSVSLEVDFELHACSDLALSRIVSEYRKKGWTVQVDDPSAARRRWKMRLA